jgi:hypothetical protein
MSDKTLQERLREDADAMEMYAGPVLAPVVSKQASLQREAADEIDRLIEWMELLKGQYPWQSDVGSVVAESIDWRETPSRMCDGGNLSKED